MIDYKFQNVVVIAYIRQMFLVCTVRVCTYLHLSWEQLVILCTFLLKFKQQNFKIPNCIGFQSKQHIFRLLTSNYMCIQIQNLKPTWLRVIFLIYTPEPRGVQAWGVRVYISVKSWHSRGISDIYHSTHSPDRWKNFRPLTPIAFMQQCLMIDCGFNSVGK